MTTAQAELALSYYRDELELMALGSAIDWTEACYFAASTQRPIQNSTESLFNNKVSQN